MEKSFEDHLKHIDRSVIEVFDSFEEADRADREYWLSRTPAERLMALEHIRQLAWGYDEESRPKLPRTSDVLQLRERPIRGARRLRS
jgi:hypothetical protein